MKIIKEKELTSIYGGHKSFFYKMGVAWMSINLTILGGLAGVADGFDSGLDKEKTK